MLVRETGEVLRALGDLGMKREVWRGTVQIVGTMDSMGIGGDGMRQVRPVGQIGSVRNVSAVRGVSTVGEHAGSTMRCQSRR